MLYHGDIRSYLGDTRPDVAVRGVFGPFQATAFHQEFPAFGFDLFDRFQIGSYSAGIDQRPDMVGRVERVADPELPIGFGQFGFNLGINSLKTEGFFYGGSGTTAYKSSYEGSASGGFFANTSLQGGFTRMVGENAGLDFTLGYIYAYNKNTFDKTTLRDNGNDGTIEETLKNETTTKYSNHGFFLNLGFQVFLRKKK